MRTDRGHSWPAIGQGVWLTRMTSLLDHGQFVKYSLLTDLFILLANAVGGQLSQMYPRDALSHASCCTQRWTLSVISWPRSSMLMFAAAAAVAGAAEIRATPPDGPVAARIASDAPSFPSRFPTFRRSRDAEVSRPKYRSGSGCLSQGNDYDEPRIR